MSYIFDMGDWKIQKADGNTISYSDFTNSVLREKESFDEKIIKKYGLDASIQSRNDGFYYSAELEFWNLTEVQYNLLLPLQGTNITIYPSELDLANGFSVFVKEYYNNKKQFNFASHVLLSLEGQALSDYGEGINWGTSFIYFDDTTVYFDGSQA